MTTQYQAFLNRIETRAQTLFSNGYTITEGMFSDYLVATPEFFDTDGQSGVVYRVKMSEAKGYSCSCPCYADHGICKHFRAVALLIEDNARFGTDAHDALMASAE